MAETKPKETEEKKEPDYPLQSIVYSWGTGRSGELGHENVDKSLQCLLPSPVTYFMKKSIHISNIACGEGYSCAITSNGDLYCWGMSYKLGIGKTNTNQREPVLIQYFVEKKERIDKVSCGECHMGVITHSRKLYLWGKSENGCIGDGNDKKHDVLLPYNVSMDELVDKHKEDTLYPIHIDLGWKTSAIITNNGCVYSWGCSTNKVLGHKHIQKNYCFPTKIDFNESKNNTDNVRIIDISFGSHHAAAVSDSGNVYCWGNNSWYNLGLGNNKNKAPYCTPQLLSKSKYFNDERVTAISCTKSMLTPVKGPGKEGVHTMAITENGHLYCFGAGHKGKCGNLLEKWGFHLKGDEDIKTPYLVGGIAYDKKNNVDTNYFKDTKIVQCVAGAIHSAVVDTNGRVYTFGCGSDGRMALKAYVEGSCGSGKQVYKFYVSTPTKIEVLDESNVSIKQVATGRRHMIALGFSDNNSNGSHHNNSQKSKQF